jgi:hypothetical protein
LKSAWTKVTETLSPKTSCTWWFSSVIPAMQEMEVEGSHSEASLGKNVRPYLKSKRTRNVVQMVGCLSSQCERSSPVPPREREQER